MTLKEADGFARKQTTVYLHGEIRYRRICKIGYEYDPFGQPHPFLALEDEGLRSITYCNPKDVTTEEIHETD